MTNYEFMYLYVVMDFVMLVGLGGIFPENLLISLDSQTVIKAVSNAC